MSARKVLRTPERAEILLANRHACCVCQRGGVQIHHIDGDPSNNAPANLAVLCFEHHDKATAPRGLTASLTPDHVRAYKADWETNCVTTASRVARSRTAFFMVDYKNPDRLRHLFSQLSPAQRADAHDRLTTDLPAETSLRAEQRFDISLEPTLLWNEYVEALVTAVLEGNPHPEMFVGAEGHPRDPLSPVMRFDQQPPLKYLYDIWCQVMARALAYARGVHDLESLMLLRDPANAGLQGKLVSFAGRPEGHVAVPAKYDSQPTSKIRLTTTSGSTTWEVDLRLRTHYVYSETAADSLSGGRQNGLLVFREVEDVRFSRGRPSLVRFSATPLIMGSGALNIP